jgi:GNAT superfamily N-acetyltransferase
MTIEIRNSTMDDLEEIQALSALLTKQEFEYNSNIDLSWPFSEDHKKTYAQFIDQENFISLVACLDDKIIGYLVGYIQESSISRSARNIANLDNMFILQEFRRQGVGSMLVKRFFSWAKLCNVDTVAVGAFVPNEKAVSFYKKNGFKPYELTLQTSLDGLNEQS